MQKLFEIFAKVPDMALGRCMWLCMFHDRDRPELLVGRRFRIHITRRHAVRVLLQSCSLARPLIRKLVARDSNVCFHFLQVDAVRALPDDVNDAIYERLVLAVLHCRWSV
jgi:hypothetical protein